MQIDVNHIKAHIPWFYLTKNRVQVCAIIVEESAGLMNDLAHLGNVLLEYTECGRVGQH